MAKKDTIAEEQNCGMVSQLILNVHNPWDLLSCIYKYIWLYVIWFHALLYLDFQNMYCFLSFFCQSSFYFISRLSFVNQHS